MSATASTTDQPDKITQQIMAEGQLEADAREAKVLIDESRKLQLRIQEFSQRCRARPEDIVLTYAMRALDKSQIIIKK